MGEQDDIGLRAGYNQSPFSSHPWLAQTATDQHRGRTACERRVAARNDAIAEMRAPELSLTFTTIISIISLLIDTLLCAAGRKQFCT